MKTNLRASETIFGNFRLTDHFWCLDALQNEGARQPEIAVKDTDLKTTLEIYHQWSGGLQGCDTD